MDGSKLARVKGSSVSIACRKTKRFHSGRPINKDAKNPVIQSKLGANTSGRREARETVREWVTIREVARMF